MIKLVKVNKYFNRRKRNQMHIINNTSLELGDNGLVAILGSSGSGKTTLLNAIGGLDKVNSGKIYINGKKITHKRAYTVDKIRNLNMGYIFQDYKLLENMSVYDNVALSLKMMGIKNKKEIQKRVNYVLEAVKMYRYRNRPAKMLSGGEKQRLAMARALYKGGRVVILDEPTAALDALAEDKMYREFEKMIQGKTAVFISHRLGSTRFCDKIAMFEDGTVVEEGTHDELMAKNGKYAYMFQIQSQYYEDKKDSEGGQNDEK